MAKLIENGIEMSLKRMLTFVRYTTAYKVIHELPKQYHKYYLIFLACTKDEFMYICAYTCTYFSYYGSNIVDSWWTTCCIKCI